MEAEAAQQQQRAELGELFNLLVVEEGKVPALDQHLVVAEDVNVDLLQRAADLVPRQLQRILVGSEVCV